MTTRALTQSFVPKADLLTASVNAKVDHHTQHMAQSAAIHRESSVILRDAFEELRQDHGLKTGSRVSLAVVQACQRFDHAMARLDALHVGALATSA